MITRAPSPETTMQDSAFNSGWRRSPDLAMGARWPKFDRYPGSKGGAGVVQQVINQMPPHMAYVEPFLGSGCVMRAKRPAEINWGYDLDAAVIAKWGEAAGARADGHFRFEVGNGVGACNLHGLRAGAEKTLIYADPPYLFETRRDKGRLYRCEFGSRIEHAHLVSALQGLNAMVILSGYPSSLYAEMLEDWRVVTFWTTTRSGARVQECLWCNFPEPTALHDYRFLGNDFRSRSRIAKKVRRWVAKWKRLPPLERGAIAERLGLENAPF